MPNDPVLSIGFTAAAIWVALLVLARREADFDWSKMLLVTTGIIVANIFGPLLLCLFLFENLELDPRQWWSVVVLVTVCFQTFIFVFMLQKYLWVPVHKGLVVFVLLQLLMIGKEYVLHGKRDQGFAAFAWATVMGRDLAHEGQARGELDWRALEVPPQTEPRSQAPGGSRPVPATGQR